MKSYNTSLIIGLIIAGINYFILTFYDLLALENENEKLPLKKVAPISFMAFAFKIIQVFQGFYPLQLRFRLYGVLKIKISLFSIISFWAGLTKYSSSVSRNIYENIFIYKFTFFK